MKRMDHMKLGLFICSLAISTCTACSTSYKRPRNILKMEEYAIATQADHFVACKIAVKYQCGITLMECSDGMKYECSQSVLVFNINDIPSAIPQEE